MLKIDRDPENRTAYIGLRPGVRQVSRSVRVHDQVILDVDSAGRLLGVELLDLDEDSQVEPRHV